MHRGSIWAQLTCTSYKCKCRSSSSVACECTTNSNNASAPVEEGFGVLSFVVSPFDDIFILDWYLADGNTFSCQHALIDDGISG